ncbi:MAG: VCBS repeat-containing protein [Caldilineaceae bacterium]
MEQTRFDSLFRQVAVHSLAIVLTLFCSLLITTLNVHAQMPEFDERSTFGSPFGFSNAVGVGDMDGDGDLDILAERYESNLTPNVLYELMLNNGDGTFAAPHRIDIAPFGYPRATNNVLLADMDGDGDLDHITRLGGISVVNMNDGAGNFSTYREVGASVVEQTVGDVDGDGDFDIVVYNTNQTYQLYRNNGSGFTSSQPLDTVDQNIVELVLCDVNGDHALDLVALGNEVKVYQNDGQGAFSFLGSFGNLNGFSYYWDMKLGDLDGDLDQDVVIAQGDQQSLIFLNDGTGHFPVTRTLGAADSFVTMLELGDVDDDGDLDIAAVAAGQSTVFVNDGTSNFTQLLRFSSAGDATTAVELADLDGDHDLDLIAAGDSGPNLIYVNRGAGNFTVPHAFGLATANAKQIEVGDLNGDQQLDLIVAGGLTNNAPNVLYFGDGNGSFPVSATFGSPDSIYSIAIGDMDGDRDLDVVAGGKFAAPSLVYLNDGAGNLTPGSIFDAGTDGQLSKMVVGVGDLDNDGDLDIVGGRAGFGFPAQSQSYIYLNDGKGNFSTSRSFETQFDTNAVALGDMDNDGDLDIVTTHYNIEDSFSLITNLVHLNDGQGNFPTVHSFGLGNDQTQDLALADIDGDGALDIIAANAAKQGSIYRNDGQGNLVASQNFGSWLDAPQHVATTDIDGDGDLDIIANGNSEQNFIYLNDGLGNFSTPITFPGTLTNLATGDMDGDGDMDIATVNDPGQGVVYLNRKGNGQILARRPGNTPLADFFSTTEIFAERLIPISYTLTSPDNLAFGSISAFYSLNGGGKWLPAIASQATITQNLAASPTGVEHLFVWDTYASGLLGQADAAVVRLVALPQARAYSQTVSSLTSPLLTLTDAETYHQFFPLILQLGASGTFRYQNLVGAPYQHPFMSTTTFPFRVRGTQVRVIDDQGNPVASAQVYRLPNGTTSNAELMPNASQPATTTVNGYLSGRGALAIGDQLLAMVPISHNLNYTLYATSGIPNENGLTMKPVSQAGVQTLTVSAAHPLLLFDLDVSVEWDASNDGLFYQQLTTAFQRASAILYDVSDGQIALGEVRIHPNREAWLSADVVIYANNNLRPRATMGGLVESPANDVQAASGKALKDAYTPGQVRMGPIWDPFGQNFAELTQDWQRALAHELAHYLLYLPDNYLGVGMDRSQGGENRILTLTDCQGSLMTDAYNPDYSELLTDPEWRSRPPCLNTVAAQLLTQRSDWATVRHFYPQLITPANKLVGPALLPLNVTHVRLIEPTTPQAQPVAARNYDLRDENGTVTVLRQAQAYLLQSHGTPTTSDDALLYLGSTGVGSDRIMVRGALAGDKVCVIDNASTSWRAGCETVTPQSTSIRLRSVPGWQPDIQISPVTSTTFQLTVTQANQVGQLSVQLLPAYGPSDDASAIRSVTQPLNQSPAAKDTYTARISLPYPIFEGFVRVYNDSAPDQFQAMTQFFLSGDWGPPGGWRGGNGVNRAWGANRRSLEAPAASGDGKVTILNLADLLADPGDTTIQAVNDLPHLPLWLTPVGAGYRIYSGSALTRTLMFEYSQRDVPPGYEQTLNLYYLPVGGSEWQRLVTGPLAGGGVDPSDNLATVVMPTANRGNGIYALMATVQLHPLVPGWNPLNDPVGAAQSVTNALASLDGAYTTVYAYQPGAPLPWPLCDRTVAPAFAPLVNTLVTMTFGSNYLIYATQVVTPYIGVVGDGQGVNVTAANVPDVLVEPPATFYGFVDTQRDPSLHAGMTMRAKIGSAICGNATLQTWQGQLAYVIQVKADSGDGCGQGGQIVNFEIDGKSSSLTAMWDNRQVTQIRAGGTLYLPIIAR